VVWGNEFLLVKAAGAAVLAWVLARSVFGLSQPFLAPWAALLTVHATVYRTSWPPLRDRTAARQVDVIDDRLGSLLCDIARDMREGREAQEAERWVERTRELDQDISEAWAVLRQARESGRLNLRRTAAVRVDASHGLQPLLARVWSRRWPTPAAWRGRSRAPRRAAPGSPASARRGSTSSGAPVPRSARPTPRPSRGA
jgi:hypothetical protein